MLAVAGVSAGADPEWLASSLSDGAAMRWLRDKFHMDSDGEDDFVEQSERKSFTS